jgi:hypothetical protein
LFFFLKKKSISPHTLNMYAIYIYKKPLHIFVLGLKLYRKVKKIKKKEEAINSSIVEYVFFFLINRYQE